MKCLLGIFNTYLFFYTQIVMSYGYIVCFVGRGTERETDHSLFFGIEPGRFRIKGNKCLFAQSVNDSMKLLFTVQSNCFKGQCRFFHFRLTFTVYQFIFIHTYFGLSNGLFHFVLFKVVDETGEIILVFKDKTLYINVFKDICFHGDQFT